MANYTRKPQDQVLRRRLTELTTSSDEVDSHPRLAEELRSEHPHSIRALQTVDPKDFKASHFNCHAFAFRLIDWPEFSSFVMHPDVWPDGWFVSDLLPLEEKSPQEASDGDVVVYFADDLVVHSGLVQGALVHSKWGRLRPPLGTCHFRNASVLRNDGPLLHAAIGRIGHRVFRKRAMEQIEGRLRPKLPNVIFRR